MLCWRITPKIFSHLQRTCLHDIRTYKFLAPYDSCNVLERKDLKQHDLVFRGLAPVICHQGTSYSNFFVSKAFTSKASESDAPRSEEEADLDPQPESIDPVRLIYTFPHISTARTIAKVKIFQTALVVAAIPYLYAGFLNGAVSQLQFLSSFAVMTFATTMLYVISDSIRKIICIMKYNNETNEVLISHLTFWGKRRNVSIPVSNIVPVSDSSENISDTYIKVNTYDKSESFVIAIKGSSEEERKDVLKIIG